MPQVTDPAILAALGGQTRVPGGPRTVVLGAADPNRAAAANATNIRSAADAAALPYAGKKAEADARKAAADAARAERELATTTAVVDPKLAAAIKGLGLDELLAGVASARKEIGSGRATGVTGAFARLIPGTTANDLSGSFDQIQGSIILEKLNELKAASATGASGMGALSEREGQRLAASVAALNTKMSDQKMLESLAAIERHANALRAVGNGENPDDPAVAKKYGIIVDKPNTPAGGTPPAAGGTNPPGGSPPPNTGLANGETKMVSDPQLAGVNAHVASMITKGANEQDVRSYLDTLSPGLGGRAQHIGEWINFHNQHPDKPVLVDLERHQEIMTPAASMLNQAAQSGPGAALIGAADTLSAGTLDNMTSNPALTRAGMAGVADAHPGWNLGGQVGGSALQMALTGGGLAKLGVNGMAGALAGDVLPGMAYGAGSADDGSRTGGAVEGGLAALLGHGAGKIAGRAISGITDPAVQYLSNQGIRLTPGRLFGGAAQRMEDRLAGLPLVGDVVVPQMKRMKEDAALAAFKQASPDVTDIGQPGYLQLKQAETKAYNDAVGGVSIAPTQQDQQAMADAVMAGAKIPGLGPDFVHLVDNNLRNIIGDGNLTGDGYQNALRFIRKRRSDYNKMGATGSNPLGSDVADALHGVEGALTGAVTNQAPEVVPALQAANALHAKKEAIKGAMLAADAQGGVFSMPQLARASISGTKKFGGSDAAALGDRPFNELTTYGSQVIPQTVPDSGTAGRMLIPGALGFLGGGAGAAGGYNTEGNAQGAAEGGGLGVIGGLGTAAALSSPYVLRAAIQKALTAHRPDIAIKLGEMVSGSRIPGALAVPLLAGGN